MDNDRWFEQQIRHLQTVNTALPQAFKAVAAAQLYHDRQHGREDKLQWCASCQAFFEENEDLDTHPHMLGGYDHSRSCWQCVAYDMFTHLVAAHLGEHAASLEWYSCEVCEGWYPPEEDEDHHLAHVEGVFQIDCSACQQWEWQAEILLMTTTATQS